MWLDVDLAKRLFHLTVNFCDFYEFCKNYSTKEQLSVML